jgi:O-methyltransferase/aklanonic acid methyltransferase
VEFGEGGDPVTGGAEAAWSALAPAWDTSAVAWNTPVAGRLVGLAGLRPGIDVLDAGCGAGAATIPAARIVRPGRVTGIDSSAAMIARARQRAAEADAENVLFLCEDAMSPSFAPATFDAVISSMVVQHLSSPATALQAWLELLRPGGVIALSWAGAEDPAWVGAFDAVDKFLPPGDRWAARRRLTAAEVRAVFPDGLDVSTITEPVTARYVNMDHWWESSWTQAPAIAWWKLPESAKRDARQAAFAVLAGLQARDGSLERKRSVCYTTVRTAPPSAVSGQARG